MTRAAAVLLLALSAPLAAAEADLAGLWQARRLFGPELAGPLLLRQVGDRLVAEIGGRRVDVPVAGRTYRFALADGSRFEGVREAGGDIVGHWLQPPSRLDGNVFATPVRLERGTDDWKGTVAPHPDTGTFYLLLRPDGGTLRAELINPERNLGVFTELTRLTLEGEAVSLHGSFRGRGPERVMLGGRYDREEDLLAVTIPGRGGLYELRRVEPAEALGFLARPEGGDPVLSPPPALDDGWPTASIEEVGIDPNPIRELIERHVLPPPVGPHDLSVHALLIARRGYLAVEEYFHGFHRDLPHDSRSASKSVTAILAAAAMHAGAALGWETAVYPLFETGDLLARQPERGEITLEHLVNMSSGLDCDDRNPDSAANEDVLWDHADELDFYRHLLTADVVHPPGTVAAYCSAGANLAGGVIAAAAGESLLQLLHRLLAEPLDVPGYAVPVPPDGHPYMGGGIRWRPRDFLKFPQLLLDGGQWRGRRILRDADARRLITPAVKIDGGRDYGYLWWTVEYPVHGRTVTAHFMGGNGGQVAMLVPELELALAFQAGNYGDGVMFRIQNELIPRYVLPAVGAGSGRAGTVPPVGPSVPRDPADSPGLG